MSSLNNAMLCIGPWGPLIRDSKPWLSESINHALARVKESEHPCPLFLERRQVQRLKKEWENSLATEEVHMSDALHLGVARFCAQVQAYVPDESGSRLNWQNKNKLALPYNVPHPIEKNFFSHLEIPEHLHNAYRTVSQMVFLSNLSPDSSKQRKEPLQWVPLFNGYSVVGALNRIAELAALCRKDSGASLERIPYWIGQQFNLVEGLKRTKTQTLEKQYDEAVNTVLQLLNQEQTDEHYNFENEKSPTLARVKYHSFFDSHINEFARDYNEMSAVLKKSALHPTPPVEEQRLGVGFFNLLDEIAQAKSLELDLELAYKTLTNHPAFTVLNVATVQGGDPLVMTAEDGMEAVLGEKAPGRLNELHALVQDLHEISGESKLELEPFVFVSPEMAVEVLTQLASTNVPPF